MSHKLINSGQLRAALRSWTGDWGGRLTVIFGLFFIYYVCWILLIQPPEQYKILVTDIAQPLVSLGMTILAWRASRHPSLEAKKRRAWRILTIAFLMYFIGNIAWGYYELIAGQSPSVSWADVPYLLYYPICLTALLSFPLERAGKTRLTFALDAGTVMLGATIVIWYLILRPVALAEYSGTLETVVTLAYPVSNTVLLFGVIAVLLRRPPKNAGIALRILTLAIFFDAVADFGYSYQTLENSYFGGQWPDCFYLLSFVLMAFSAQYQYRHARSGQSKVSDEVAEKSPFSWLPYVAVGVAYSLVLFVTYQHEREHGMESIAWLIAGAFLITALVVGRQIGALRENSRLLEEKAARESEARLGALVQHSSDIITILGRNRNVLYMSPCVERIFGFQVNELVGTQLRDYLHPEDRQRVLDGVAEISKEPGKTCSVELRSRHRDGHWIHLEAVLTNLFHEPSVSGIVINSRNITERKKAEDALRDSEEKLRQAQKMEAVGQLAGGVAHDFNNLLAVIIGYSELIPRQLPAEGNERALQQIGEIRKAGERAKSLTSQLLAFSRKQVMQPKVLDLNAVVNDMDKMMRRLIGEHIDVRTVLVGGLGRVKADPGQVEQVLLNLAVNARDAMPNGGSITIETANVELDASYAKTHRLTNSGRHVMIAVSDTGCGMSTELQSRIFEPFFTTKEKDKGTGLGLSTVYGIIQQSGGNVWVYSEPGHGTTFKIYLPRVDEVAPAVESAADISDTLTGTETVLLVEDDKAVRHMAQEILQLNGYKVLDASNGKEAIRVTEEYSGDIDLMISDVVMPQIGGRELAETLSLTRPRMRVLYMSGYTDDAIVHHGVLDGLAAFLEKPFTPDALALKVREVLAAS
jgi:PAS domain S-box-containing protein